MSEFTEAGSRIFAEDDIRDDFTADRIRWLIRLRWVAMAGVLLAASFVLAGFFPGVAWPVLLGVALVGGLYNARLSIAPLRRGADQWAAVYQALVDLVLLTIALWAAGGIASPFVDYYIFHVMLMAILGGPRATAVAVVAALVGVGFLALTELVPALKIGVWAPVPPWKTIANVVAFASMLAAATYIVLSAVHALRDRERALARARDHAELEYQVISNTVDELEAGLEVIGPDGQVKWRNRLAGQLALAPSAQGLWRCAAETRHCVIDPAGLCPVLRARDEARSARCRFSVDDRVYEMLAFPLKSRDGQKLRIMNLYVDRTQMVNEERRLLQAERLASLGRVAQGVAHELNTPLATIRTLASDIREAIHGLKADPVLLTDLGESAALIRDETQRLGRITRALLAGGDLPNPRMESSVELLPVVQRAQSLVFAGMRGTAELVIADGVQAFQVRTDPDRLLQVLVNLLQNAVDANRESGGKRVYVSALGRGPLVEVRVDDEGPGLDPKIARRLFEPFATTKPPGEGTGLGLYASYMLVESMGGDLLIENRAGGGASARVRLPLETETLAKDSEVPHRAFES